MSFHQELSAKNRPRGQQAKGKSLQVGAWNRYIFNLDLETCQEMKKLENPYVGLESRCHASLSKETKPKTVPKGI